MSEEQQRVELLASSIIALVETLIEVGCPVGAAVPALTTVVNNSLDEDAIRSAEALIVEVEEAIY